MVFHGRMIRGRGSQSDLQYVMLRMTDIENIRFFWRYMVHADQQIAAAAATVTEDGFVQDQGISFGSIQKLLGHAIAAQKVWLRRLRGEDVAYAEEPPLSLHDVAARWDATHQGLLAFAESQTSESIQAVIRSRTRTGRRFEVPAWAVMLHVSDHATYHRGQINTMIKRAGGKPSPVMLYTYAVEEKIGLEI
jgi:uncharacterized damage-inducible protein DinB